LGGRKGIRPVKNLGVVGAPLVRLGWRPPGLSVPLPPLSSPLHKNPEDRRSSLNAAQPYAKAEGRVFLLVPAYAGCPGTKAVKRLLLLLSSVRQ